MTQESSMRALPAVLAGVLTGVLLIMTGGCSGEPSDEPLEQRADEALEPRAEKPSEQRADEPLEQRADEPLEQRADEPASEASDPVEQPPPDDVDRADEGTIRAVWVHLFDDTLKSGASIDRLVAEVEASGANTLIAQVARRHDAYYDSVALPRTADPQLEPGLDVLDRLVSASAGTDLRIHAWISVAPTWHASYDELDHPDGWLPIEHGLRAPVDERWVSRTSTGEWTEYLDPALPQVTEHVVAVAEELAQRYPIAGVHLDYVRYEGADRGYHPDALRRFAQETGRADVPDPDDPEWSGWRRGQTRGLITAVRAALDATGTRAQLSAPVIAWGEPPAGATLEGTRTYDDALQDWAGWAREGVVDTLFPMNYFRAHVPEQAAWFDGWVAFGGTVAADTDARIAAGVAGWLNQPDAVLDQVHTAMATTDGVALYSYQQPTEGDRLQLFSRLATEGWTTSGP